MVIHFCDGSYAECYEIEVIGDKIYWDGCRYMPKWEVEYIEDDDGSDVTCEYIGCSSRVNSRYVKASEDKIIYVVFFNGEILDTFDDYDKAEYALKDEINETIAMGAADSIDFSECWIEDEYDEEVMYIADGDDDYAEYL